jgi:hypothetical protein
MRKPAAKMRYVAISPAGGGVARDEDGRDDPGEISVEREVVPLDDVADEAAHDPVPKPRRLDGAWTGRGHASTLSRPLLAAAPGALHRTSASEAQPPWVSATAWAGR